MIARDANVLVRYFANDDAAQSAAAILLIEDKLSREQPGLVTIVTIVELAWVLERPYKASPQTVLDIVRRLLSSSQIIVEQATVVEAATAHSHGDLADALIHEIGRAEGCSKTVTFDREFARLADVELLIA